MAQIRRGLPPCVGYCVKVPQRRIEDRSSVIADSLRGGGDVQGLTKGLTYTSVARSIPGKPNTSHNMLVLGIAVLISLGGRTRGAR